MAKIYLRQIKAGKMTIEDVPDLWRAQVEKLLEEDKAKEDEEAERKAKEEEEAAKRKEEEDQRHKELEEAAKGTVESEQKDGEP